MNPNDTIVLSTTSVVAPSLLGMLIWPHIVLIVLIASFVTLSCLFLVFKQRNQTK